MFSSPACCYLRLLVLFGLSFLVACITDKKETLFRSLPSTATNIHFVNQVNEIDSTHSFINEFGYMGGGVGIGDLYRNNGNYTFTDVSQQAGVGEASMSNDAAWADLDNDGDLDIVVNNINKETFVLINGTNQKEKPITHHYISIAMKEMNANRNAFGAKVKVYTNELPACRK